jgi:hypothetical protein
MKRNPSNGLPLETVETITARGRLLIIALTMFLIRRLRSGKEKAERWPPQILSIESS